MGVPTRNTFLAGLAALSTLALAGVAYAGGGGSPCGAMGCGGGNPGPSVPTPTTPSTPVIPGVNTGGLGSPGCCGNMPKGTNIQLPGVNVAGPTIAVNTPNVGVSGGNIVFNGNKVFSSGNAGGGQTTFLSGGGAFFAPQGIAPSTLSGLNVSGAEERFMETVTEQVPVSEQVCVNQSRPTVSVRPVQAVCLDDKGTPHPASQVTSERDLGAAFTGEIYRCMAGTSMQVTMGHLNGNTASFDRAETFSCQKGEALVRRPTGELSCTAQAPQRDCNERSLLRQHGSGIKLIQTRASSTQCVPQTRTRMETRTRQVERVRQAEPAGPIVLDGGVGQGVF